MAAVSHTISSLLNGVSQQPAISRLPSQVEAQVNCWSNLVQGLSRRPPWKHTAKLVAGDTSAYTNCIVHSVNRDDSVRYTIILRSGVVEVYDTLTGASQMVTTPNGTAYLNCTNPQTELRLLTEGDYTFIVNRNIAVALTSEVTPSYTYGGTVAAMSELNAHDASYIGKYWKVAPDSQSAAGVYYIAYRSDGSGSGYWTEIAKPGIPCALDPSTMPHAIVANPDGTFTFKELPWEKRAVGDELTVPQPSIVGRKLTDVFFARRRLGMISGPCFIMSAGNSDFYNLWRAKSTQVLATDPIDITYDGENTAGGFHSAAAYSQDVILFSLKGQFRVASIDVSLSPNTLDIKPVSKFSNSPICRPLTIGGDLYYTYDTDKWAAVTQFLYQSDGAPADAGGVTDHIPEYIPNQIIRLAASAEGKLVAALSRNDRTALYVWSHYEKQMQRQQSSWSKWLAPTGTTILDVSADKWLLVVALKAADGIYLATLNTAPQPTDDSSFYMVHLDRRLLSNQVSMSYMPGYTVFVLPYGTTEQLYIVPIEANPANGIVDRIALTATGTPNVWTASGNWTGVPFFIGMEQLSSFELSELFPPRASNAASNDKALAEEGRLTVQSVNWLLDQTSGLVGIVTDKSDEASFGDTGMISIAGVSSVGASATPISKTLKLSGKRSTGLRKTTKWRLPVNRRSTHAIIQMQSLDHRPFHVISAQWYGNYSYTRQQV